MANVKTLAITMLIIIALTACKTITPTQRTPTYHTGTKGLELTTLQNAPPALSFETDNIPFVVELHNQGATDIEGGIYALGIEESILNSQDDRIGTFDLQGKNEFNPDGAKTRHSFRLKARPLDPQTETYTTTIAYTACYPYETVGSTTVCIDPDIFNEKTAKPCTPKSTTMGSGQGAPINIGKIDTRMLTHQDKNKIVPEFTISINNAQNGVVVATDQTERACSSEPLQPNTIGIVSIKAQLGDQQLTCQPRKDEKTRTATIKIGTGTTVRCTLPEGIPTARGTYNTILQVTAEYGYTTTISKQVQIKRR